MGLGMGWEWVRTINLLLATWKLGCMCHHHLVNDLYLVGSQKCGCNFTHYLHKSHCWLLSDQPRRLWGLDRKSAELGVAKERILSLINLVSSHIDLCLKALKEFDISGFKEVFFDTNCTLSAFFFFFKEKTLWGLASTNTHEEVKKNLWLKLVQPEKKKIASNQLPHTFLKDLSVHFLLFWVWVKRDSNWNHLYVAGPKAQSPKCNWSKHNSFLSQELRQWMQPSIPIACDV